MTASECYVRLKLWQGCFSWILLNYFPSVSSLNLNLSCNCLCFIDKKIKVCLLWNQNETSITFAIFHMGVKQINPFQVNYPFYTPWKNSENQRLGQNWRKGENWLGIGETCNEEECNYLLPTSNPLDWNSPCRGEGASHQEVSTRVRQWEELS